MKTKRGWYLRTATTEIRYDTRKHAVDAAANVANPVILRECECGCGLAASKMHMQATLEARRS